MLALKGGLECLVQNVTNKQLVPQKQVNLI